MQVGRNRHVLAVNGKSENEEPPLTKPLLLSLQSTTSPPRPAECSKPVYLLVAANLSKPLAARTNGSSVHVTRTGFGFATMILDAKGQKLTNRLLLSAFFLSSSKDGVKDGDITRRQTTL